MYIGYNISKANEAMEQVKNAYDGVKGVVETEWSQIQSTLREQWVGPDEQDFEKKLKTRMEGLLTSAHDLTSGSIDVLYELGVAWANFQDSNTISGEAVGVSAQLISGLQKPTLPASPELSFVALTFDASTNMGLKNKNSAGKITGALNDLYRQVKSTAKRLFNEVDTKSAFYGDIQKKKLKEFIDTVEDSLVVLSTSFKDFDDAMVKLTGESYGTADTDLDQVLTEVTGKVSAAAESEDSAATRWK